MNTASTKEVASKPPANASPGLADLRRMNNLAVATEQMDASSLGTTSKPSPIAHEAPISRRGTLSKKRDQSNTDVDTLETTKFQLAYTKSAFPQKMKKLSLHQTPSNWQNNLGIEWMSASLRQWGSKQKIVLNDHRIPTTVYPCLKGHPHLVGTALEIVQDTSNSTRYHLVILTGQGSSESTTAKSKGSLSALDQKPMIAIRIGWIDAESDIRLNVSFCFEELPGYSTDSQLAIPDAPTPESKEQSVNELPFVGDISYRHDIVMQSPPHGSLPMCTILGEFKAEESTEEKRAGTEEKSKLLFILKRPAPSRTQKLVGEVKSIAIAKKSLLDTKFMAHLELFEENLWFEMASAAALTGGFECAQVEDVEVQWAYRKEWWSLAILGALAFGFSRDG